MHALVLAARLADLGPGDLQVSLLARNDQNVQTRRPRDLHIVRRAAGVRPVRGKDRGQVKALRRLRAPQPGPVGGAGHKAVGAAPQRIRHRQGRGGGRGPGMQRRQHPDQFKINRPARCG